MYNNAKVFFDTNIMASPMSTYHRLLYSGASVNFLMGKTNCNPCIDAREHADWFTVYDLYCTERHLLWAHFECCIYLSFVML